MNVNSSLYRLIVRSENDRRRGNESLGSQMKLRKFLVFLGWTAAAGLNWSPSCLAGEVQSGNGLDAQESESCARVTPDFTEGTDPNLCKEVNGHIRVNLDSPSPNPQGYGRPGTSHIAVRIEDGSSAPNHLRLPSSDWGLDPFQH